MAHSIQDTAIRNAVATGAAPVENFPINQHQYQRARNEALREYTCTYVDTTTDTSSTSSKRTKGPDEPPRFVIDLSLPPEQRYIEVCAAFKVRIQGVTPLFDEVVQELLLYLPRPLSSISTERIHQLARLLLRRVYDEEENRELQGISKLTGIDMHMLVSFNVLLDFLMGCSSGGAVVRDENGETKMMHFRTLDWGMPSLRKLVCQLDFKTQQDGPIIASSVTYAGYVGVLTGVRNDFSVSLNYRPSRNKGSVWSSLAYCNHLLMVLLGKRRSISSQLRSFLLPERLLSKEGLCTWKYWSYSDVVARVGGITGKPLTTTVCYLCLSNGDETTVIEKDRVTAVVRSSDEFIAIANNDLDHEIEANIPVQKGEWEVSLADVISESKDRRQCVQHNYYTLREHAAHLREEFGPRDSLKSALTVENIIHMVQWYPTTNQMTHFACVMDPKEGVVRWCRRWARPLTKKWISEHEGFQRYN